MGKGPEQTLLQGGHTEGPETYERMLSITSRQEMKIKTPMRYHFIPVRMATINKSTNNKRKRNPDTLLVGMQTGAATVGNGISSKN